MLRASSLGLYLNLRLPCQTTATLRRRLARHLPHTDPRAHAEAGCAVASARRALLPEFEVGCSRDAGPVGDVGRAETDGGGTTAVPAAEEDLDPEVQRRMAKIRLERVEYRRRKKAKNKERREQARTQLLLSPEEVIMTFEQDLHESVAPETKQPLDLHEGNVAPETEPLLDPFEERGIAQEIAQPLDPSEKPTKARPPHTLYGGALLKVWPERIPIPLDLRQQESAALRQLLGNGDDEDDIFPYLYQQAATATIIEELPASACPADTFPSARRYRLLYELATVQCPDAAWAAYVALARLPAPPHAHWLIPFAHLHRVVRVLGTAQRTRRTYLRVLSVLRALHRAGGRTMRWEWNLLMDCAGNGLRRTRPTDFAAAVEVYLDMTGGRAPGSTFAERRRALAAETDEEADEGSDYQLEFTGRGREGDEGEDGARTPDIYTYETLLTIAAASRHHASIRYASGLLARSGLTPTPGCHLALVSYYATRGELSGVRSAILRMHEQGLRLNGTAINACLWAYVRVGRVDIAGALYRVLRAHAVPEDEPDAVEDVRAADAYLREHERIAVPPGLTPDEVTFQIMVQGYARAGDFARCVAALGDMLSIAPRPRDGPPLPPMLHAYRAVFLGFFHHGLPPEAAGDAHGWTAEHLRTFLARFLELGHGGPLSERLFFWIIMAFSRTTGRDAREVRDVWVALEAKFGKPLGGRLRTLKRRVFAAADAAGEGGHRSNPVRSHKLDD